jgi:hypothetical protein
LTLLFTFLFLLLLDFLILLWFITTLFILSILIWFLILRILLILWLRLLLCSSALICINFSRYNIQLRVWILISLIYLTLLLHSFLNLACLNILIRETFVCRWWLASHYSKRIFDLLWTNIIIFVYNFNKKKQFSASKF